MLMDFFFFFAFSFALFPYRRLAPLSGLVPPASPRERREEGEMERERVSEKGERKRQRDWGETYNTYTDHN